MKYELISLPGDRKAIEITKDQYHQIEDAKRISILLLAVEEKFDFVLENYAHYERELMNLTVDQMIYKEHDWFTFRDDLQIINLRISNLLSSARLYIDQSKHDASTILGRESAEYRALERKMSEEYDRTLGYRAMEAIRNYTQHFSVPVHGLSYPITRKNMADPAGPAKTIYRTVPLIEVSELKTDPKIKRSLIAELEKLDERPETSEKIVNITPLIREYVEGLSRVHEKFRSLTSSQAQQTEKIMKEAIASAQKEFGEKEYLAIIGYDPENDNFYQEEHISDNLLIRRDKLLTKNRFLDSLSRRFVSSE